MTLSWPEVYSIDMEQILYNFQYILPYHYMITPDELNEDDQPESADLKPESFIDEDLYRDEL